MTAVFYLLIFSLQLEWLLASRMYIPAYVVFIHEKQESDTDKFLLGTFFKCYLFYYTIVYICTY